MVTGMIKDNGEMKQALRECEASGEFEPEYS
jgi:hypothetical protein